MATDEAGDLRALLQIWSLSLDDDGFKDDFRFYYKHHKGEISRFGGLDESGIFFLIKEVLQKMGDVPRGGIRSELNKYPSAVPSAIKKLVESDELEGALLIAVRIMLGLDLAVPKGGETAVGKEVWQEMQSLQQFVENTFIQEKEDLDPIPIRQTKLQARYLGTYAKITIEWTSDLSQHLVLEASSSGKTVRIFEHVPLLVGMHRALKGKDMGMKLSESLKFLMCLKRMCDQLLEPATLFHSPSQYPPGYDYFHRPIRTNKALFERYPHWAMRLELLFEEAEDPIPVTAAEKWAERRKGPRYTFWITTVAFVFALLFGLITLGLGGVQIWISYCDWRGTDDGRRGC
ncbi:hypothetical protein OQA88_13330 [Cercophora sp. LCS_1]